MVEIMVLLLLNKETDLVVVEVVPVVLLLDRANREVELPHPVVQERLSHNSLDLEYIL